jgi:hypothetical protein
MKAKTTQSKKTSSKVSSINPPKGKGLFNLLYFFGIMCLLIVGWTFSNILHFAIEDVYHQPPQYNMFFGMEYATSTSWLLITSLVFLVLSFYSGRLLRKEPALFHAGKRQFFLKVLLVAGCIVAAFYIVHIIYSFFSGKSDVYGLLRILVTLFVLLCGMVYALIEYRCEGFVRRQGYFFFLSFFILLASATGVSITLHNASPAALRVLHQDLKRTEDIKTIAFGVKTYFKSYEKLPASLEELADKGILKKQNLQDPINEPYQYKPIAHQSFEVCAAFQGNDALARRVHRDVHFEKGLQCQRFFIETSKEGHLKLTISTSPSIHINVYDY